MGDAELHQLTRRGPQRSLFVRPIAPSTRPDELKLEFQKFGKVRDVHVPCDFRTRAPRGFAYVELVIYLKVLMLIFYNKNSLLAF